jgi:hypothetical protein
LKPSGNCDSFAPLSCEYSSTGTHLAPISQASLSDRLLTIPFEIISYFNILLFPRDLSVARHFVVSSVGDVRFLASLLVLVVAGFVAARYCLKPSGRVPAFFALWFIIALIPALNLVPLDMTIAERILRPGNCR